MTPMMKRLREAANVACQEIEPHRSLSGAQSAAVVAAVLGEMKKPDGATANAGCDVGDYDMPTLFWDKGMRAAIDYILSESDTTPHPGSPDLTRASGSDRQDEGR